MKDLVNIAVAKLEKKKKTRFYSNSLCSFSVTDSINSLNAKKLRGLRSSSSPAEAYENTLAKLNLVNDIYCKDALGNFIPVRVDFNTNIVLPELS